MTDKEQAYIKLNEAIANFCNTDEYRKVMKSLEEFLLDNIATDINATIVGTIKDPTDYINHI